MKHSLLLCFFLLLCTCGRAQSEIDWTININIDQIVKTDKRIFAALEKDIYTFLNGTIWTDDKFELEERIEATLFLTISEVFEESNGTSVPVPNQYKATMAVQSLRPIFGTAEKTAILNTQDKNIAFAYRQGEGVQYSEQSYQSDLGHVLAYYCYLIIGMDYDTFSQLGGQEFFDDAIELYNRLPTEVQNSQGWRSTSRTRNRYWLLENIQNPKMLTLRRAYYNYHRQGLDLMHQDVVAGRNNITLAIEDANAANQTYPQSMYIQAFVDAKREEIIQIYKGASGVEQNKIITMMSRVDRSKASDYRNIRAGATSTRRPSASTRRPAGLGRQ
ncbi:MAG: DUF4835 family protein [Bacteroidota bacterium]